MISRLITMALLAAGLTACANTGQSGTPSVATTADPMGAAALAELPTQVLAPGQCALVLWSRNSTPVRFAVTLDRPAVARVSMKGRMVELERVAQNGQSIHGQFSEQRYRGNGMSLEVSFLPEDARMLAGGAVVSSAVVEFDDPAGWTSVVPAVGLIACQG